MNMNRVYQITGAVFLLLALLSHGNRWNSSFTPATVQGRDSSPSGSRWPWAIGGPDDPEGHVPGTGADAGGLLRQPDRLSQGGAIVAALAFTTALLEIVAFADHVGDDLFLLFALGRPGLIATLLVSAAGSFGCFYLFDRWLKVPLPTGFFGY